MAEQNSQKNPEKNLDFLTEQKNVKNFWKKRRNGGPDISDQ